MCKASQTSPATTSTVRFPNDKLRIGFIGFGTIAHAIAQGIVAQEEVPIQSMAISRRSVRNSAPFQRQNPGLVDIHDDPQDIVNASPDIVFLCVLPELVPKVLEQITFGDDGTKPLLVSLVAGTSIEELSSRANGLEKNDIVKMICTPSIANHEGISLLLRGSLVGTTEVETKQEEKKDGETEEDEDALSALLTAMGGYQACRNSQEMNVLMTGACVMGPMYALMQAHIQWMEQQQIPKDVAHKVVTKQYSAIVNDTLVGDDNKQSSSSSSNRTASSSTDNVKDCQHQQEGYPSSRVQRLLDEQTPNGINEQAKDRLQSLGAVSSYTHILDLMLDRLESKTS